MSRPYQPVSWMIIGLSLLFAACQSKPLPTEVVRVAGPLIQDTDACLKQVDGRWIYQGLPFSGYSVAYHPSGAVKGITPYYEGRMHGLAYTWHESGTPRSERYYLFGKKEGQHRGWWANGILKFDYHFEHGVHEGRASEWFEDGIPYRTFTYKQGQEAGTQQMWYEDGTLRANYVVRAGRRYGLIGAKPCSGPQTEG